VASALKLPFGSIYRHGYVRVAAAVPQVRIGDPAFNAERSLALVRQAHEQGTALIVFA
jgi:NAD+ synthase (glutamine-hydrolysing)